MPAFLFLPSSFLLASLCFLFSSLVILGSYLSSSDHSSSLSFSFPDFFLVSLNANSGFLKSCFSSSSSSSVIFCLLRSTYCFFRFYSSLSSSRSSSFSLYDSSPGCALFASNNSSFSRILSSPASFLFCLWSSTIAFYFLSLLASFLPLSIAYSFYCSMCPSISRSIILTRATSSSESSDSSASPRSFLCYSSSIC